MKEYRFRVLVEMNRRACRGLQRQRRWLHPGRHTGVCPVEGPGNWSSEVPASSLGSVFNHLVLCRRHKFARWGDFHCGVSRDTPWRGLYCSELGLTRCGHRRLPFNSRGKNAWKSPLRARIGATKTHSVRVSWCLSHSGQRHLFRFQSKKQS